MNPACFLPLRSGDDSLIAFLFVDKKLIEGSHYAAYLFEQIVQILNMRKRYFAIPTKMDAMERWTQSQVETIQAFDPDILIIGLEDIRIFDFRENAIAGKGHIFTYYVPTGNDECPIIPYA